MATTTTGHDVYYDPYDREILANPYPVFKRMRDEAPLYYNEPYDFYAVSRFEDVKAALVDKLTFSSEKGVLLDIIKADVEMPPGTLIHEQPPSHTVHRQLLSRVFTPKAMLAIEPEVRDFCARRLDELVDRKEFDWVTDFAQYVPMRVFGMLLGIPDEEQERVREYVEQGMNLDEPGKPNTYDEGFPTGEFYAEFLDARLRGPPRRPHHSVDHDGVRGRARRTSDADARGGARLLRDHRRRRESHHESPHQLDREGARGSPGRAARAGRRPIA